MNDPGVNSALAVLFVCLVALKLLSCSYFVSGLGMSAVAGAGGWWLVSSVVAPLVLGHGTAATKGLRLGAAAFGCLCFAAFVAYKAEQNAAPVLRVPKRECT